MPQSIPILPGSARNPATATHPLLRNQPPASSAIRRSTPDIAPPEYSHPKCRLPWQRPTGRADRAPCVRANRAKPCAKVRTAFAHLRRVRHPARDAPGEVRPTQSVICPARTVPRRATPGRGQIELLQQDNAARPAHLHRRSGPDGTDLAAYRA